MKLLRLLINQCLAKIHNIYVAIQEVYQGAFKIYSRCLYGAHKIHFFFLFSSTRDGIYQASSAVETDEEGFSSPRYHPTADSETM